MDELIARARRIAAHVLCGPEKWKPGVKAGMYEEIIGGAADAEAIVQGPLVALVESAEEIASLKAKVRRLTAALATARGSR